MSTSAVSPNTDAGFLMTKQQQVSTFIQYGSVYENYLAYPEKLVLKRFHAKDPLTDTN